MNQRNFTNAQAQNFFLFICFSFLFIFAYDTIKNFSKCDFFPKKERPLPEPVFKPKNPSKSTNKVYRLSNPFVLDFLLRHDLVKRLIEFFRTENYEIIKCFGKMIYGADILLSKDGLTTVVLVTKTYKPVTVSALKKVLYCKNRYQADKAIVTTTNRFSGNARKFASSQKIELWHRPQLIQILESMSHS